ncbi:hypothetical protein TSOC_005200 [Tetrabaena socialis]|uniref:Uncharacterized protein n=1 Tax=Tetrabaena socialis TaxID=47790 RepID=A0A2J8A6Z5_9CHLO|nr:hypothetical protein TSOC_005200 [Tetrabaena socialis]|eukprot:PNH08265.1 hypothetical protein TSOC_005200 [Tetrabaena socialis]
MAAINNAFTLLTGAEQQLSKKKKNKANKPKAEANGGPASTLAGPSSLSAPDSDLVVDVGEALALSERNAREAKSSVDKVKLWKEWTRLANDKASKFKYTDADGSNLDFKQVLLRSKALEIVAENCISIPLHNDKEAILAHLFAAFLPNDSGSCNALANLLVRLSNSLADDAPDTLGAAQRAVTGLVKALKAAAQQGPAEADAANPVAAWLSRVAVLDKDIARQQGLLQKLSAANKGVVTRETASTARQLVKLQEERFDLLQPEAVPVAKAPAGVLGGCLRSIDELKAVLSGHLKEAESKPSGPSAMDASSRAAQAAGYKREEEILTAQAAQVQQQHNVVLATASGAAPPPPAASHAAPAAAAHSGAAAAAPSGRQPQRGAPAAAAAAAAVAAASSNGAAAEAPPPKPAAPAGPPPRQWGKVDTPAPVSLGDSSLPTPAEAFKGPGPSTAGPSTSTAAAAPEPAADGFSAPAAAKKNRRRA